MFKLSFNQILLTTKSGKNKKIKNTKKMFI